MINPSIGHFVRRSSRSSTCPVGQRLHFGPSRVLAALAHLALQLVSRLRVHPARRQPRFEAAHVYARARATLSWALLEGSAAALLIAGMALFYSDIPSDFIYFQF
jgi:hypothetical protein